MTVEEGFREPGGGGGFLPMGGGGPFIDAEERGLGASDAAVFLRFAIDGWKLGALAVVGGDGRPGMGGAAPTGGLGAEAVGGFGTALEEGSGSDKYDASRFATGLSVTAEDFTTDCIPPPVSTPAPVLRSFGIPPANSPPSWGAVSITDAVD